VTVPIFFTVTRMANG